MRRLRLSIRKRAPSSLRGNHRGAPLRVLSLTALLLLAAVADAAERRIELSNGDVYEGEVVNGVRSGFGTYITAAGHRYTGYFENNRMHGEGAFYWPDERVFEGTFVNGLRNGEGTLTWPDGRVFEGTFVNDRREGRGELTWPNGNVYTGEFTDNAITGQGRLVWDNQDVYEGEFVDGMRTGWGEQTWHNGNRYVGEFDANRRHGRGAYHWRDGTVYRGRFEDNRMQGFGVKSSPDGERYFQRWRDGELVNEAHVAANARCELVLEGERWMFASADCINGLAHGAGIAVRLDGEAYVDNGRFRPRQHGRGRNAPARSAGRALMAADPGLTEHQVEIPGFRIQREVGRGAASTVYLATWGDIGREVALKVAVGDAAQDPEREQRFVRESGLVADIDHPHVVKVYDAGRGTFPYIAMEYLEGGNLIARMGRGMSVPEAVGVAKQVALALDVLSGHGIVHRDVKPENILFRGRDEAVLTDFGIAVEAGGEPSPGETAGTAPYMSPEQAAGGVVDSRSDLYSLGVVFHLMLAGKVPFSIR